MVRALLTLISCLLLPRSRQPPISCPALGSMPPGSTPAPEPPVMITPRHLMRTLHHPVSRMLARQHLTRCLELNPALHHYHPPTDV